MRAKSTLLALALMASLQPAMAAPTLTFEDVQATEQLTTRYAGAPWGVTASGAAYTAVAETCAGPDYLLGVSFSRSCGALWLTDFNASQIALSTLRLTVDGGFNALSFIYSGSVGESLNLTVRIYGDDDNNPLATISSLRGTAAGGYTFANWSDPVTKSLTSLAKYVTFTAVNGTVLFDDISFTRADAPGQLPEPGSIALALGALGALGWTRRRTATR